VQEKNRGPVTKNKTTASYITNSRRTAQKYIFATSQCPYSFGSTWTNYKFYQVAEWRNNIRFMTRGGWQDIQEHE